MKSRMSQVIIYVSDMRKSVAFYRDLLGLRLISESEQWSELDTGGFHLGMHKGSPGDEVQGEVRVPAGNAELVFEVDNLDQATKEIVQKGGAVEGPQVMEGLNLRVAFLRDPDGLAIQLIENQR